MTQIILSSVIASCISLVILKHEAIRDWFEDMAYTIRKFFSKK